MMRVTNNLLFKSGANALQNQQQEILKVQEQSVSGQRTNRPSDDPSGVYRHMIFSSDLSGVQSLKKTTQFASERLTMAESHMSQMHDTFLDAQDLVMQLGESMIGGNPSTLTAAAQKPLAWYQDMISSVNSELDEVPLFGGGKLRTPFDDNKLTATAVQVKSADGKSLATAGSGFAGSVTEGQTPDNLPLSVKISYLAASNQYQANINGVDQEAASLDENGQLDLGQGVKFTVTGTPNTGDSYYFEVVPQYQGGNADRPIRARQGEVLPGNVTGQELLEGTGNYARGVNLLGSMAALRGALLRADPTEVALQLNRVQEGRAQVSDLQGVTGIRNMQVQAVSSTLESDESSLTQVRADNVEADLFKVLSDLEQASQAMQVMTATQRQVMNTSLIDFIQ
ncbi:MAG: flagellar hook-associated protein FlgL [Magnetococcales bacterium]|nr:flagellar hook-associated protein FlgL [Magnetococcales bacterium]